MTEHELTDDDAPEGWIYDVGAYDPVTGNVVSTATCADRHTIDPSGALTLWLDGYPIMIYAAGSWSRVSIEAT